MKKIIIALICCFLCVSVYSQDSMNKKMDNKSDKMIKKMDNTTDPMNKKLKNAPDSTTTKRRAFPKRADTIKRKAIPVTTREKVIEK